MFMEKKSGWLKKKKKGREGALRVRVRGLLSTTRRRSPWQPQGARPMRPLTVEKDLGREERHAVVSISPRERSVSAEQPWAPASCPAAAWGSTPCAQGCPSGGGTRLGKRRAVPGPCPAGMHRAPRGGGSRPAGSTPRSARPGRGALSSPDFLRGPRGKEAGV